MKGLVVRVPELTHNPWHPAYPLNEEGKRRPPHAT
jgi:hypothetical protein